MAKTTPARASRATRPQREKPRRSWLARIVRWLLWTALAFFLGSILWVAAYRFVNPPITFTQLGDYLGGRRLERQWMAIERIDRDMVRAVIAGEDSKFCTHNGFDVQAIEAAMRRNARGGSVIRGGSTISQQTAKNAFLWQGGGYLRKGLEAWFTFLIEHLWDKRRIMEVYLNVAETGIGTYGANAGAQRYFGHDASSMTATEAARIAAVLPLPKEREAITPTGFTRRYGNMIAARMGAVRRDRLDGCVYAGAPAPAERAEPAARRAAPRSAPRPQPLPGEEFETQAPARRVIEAPIAEEPVAAEPQQVTNGL